jgi:hypothetical protein
MSFGKSKVANRDASFDSSCGFGMELWCRLADSNTLPRHSKLVLLQTLSNVASYREYLDYLHLLFNRASLRSVLAELYHMAVRAVELRDLRLKSPLLNGVVLGRMLNCVLPSLLTWHGGRHITYYLT